MEKGIFQLYRRFFLRGIFLSCAVIGAWVQVVAQADPTNFITIKEKAGVTTSQYPIQIGRPFVPGEVPNFPQAVVDGTPVPTQADVKGRWPDGSVKHAILSFYLPTLAANSTVTVAFVNQTAGNNAGFLDKTGMLSNAFDFDAAMQLTNGTTTVSASARSMLSNDKFSYWLQGSVMTSVVLADHSAARSADIGFDANKSFRPIFHATFWPGINKVRVRYIGENANTEAIQDQLYSLALKLGNTSPQTVYVKSSVNHLAASRWTKEFWLGGAPSAIEIKHNLAYLARTKVMSNYDTSRTVSEAALDEAYNDPYTGWSNVTKDLYDPGNMMKYMASTGGRDEIGPYPLWTVRWLYTGDKRVADQAVGNAQLSAAYPIHFREGNSTKVFDNNGTSALGRPLSIKARPTVFLNSGNFYIDFQYTDPVDKIVPVGQTTFDDWVPDGAHQPDFHSPLYALTGDYFYLEEMYFWASWGAAYTSFGTDVHWGRGPTSDTGGITGEVRGDAWLFRNRVRTAFLAPDGSPEKNYFTKLTNDAIAIWEGTVGITGTSNQGNANWNWGHTVAALKYGAHGVPTVPSLRYWEEGGTTPGWSEDVDPAIATNRTPHWQHAFLLYAFGQAQELGFATGPLLSWLAPVTIGQLTEAGYNPYMVAAYQMPSVRKMDNVFYPLWPDAKLGFFTSYNAQQDFTNQLADANHGYPFIAMTAAATVANEPGGSAAWSFMQQQVLPAPSLNNNPKWLILPRGGSAPVCTYTLGATSASVAAASGTGSVNVMAAATCSWTASSNDSWITVTSTVPVSGSGAITYSVLANNGPARTGTITIAGQTYTINQAGNCTYFLSATSVSVGASASTGSVTVTPSNAACTWTAASNTAWLTITGTSNGTVNYSVAANTTTGLRTGTMTIAGQTYTVNQDGIACNYSLSATIASVTAAATTRSVTVTATAGCSWTAVSNATGWITVTAGASGTGNGTVNFSIAPNTSTSERIGTLTIAGQNYTVTQAGLVCTYGLSATSTNVTAAATTRNVNITASNSACPWTAVSNDAWITLLSAPSGSGSTTFSFSIAANNSLTARTGTLTIAGITYTVYQAAINCTYSLSATSASVTAAATPKNVTLTVSNGICPWTAVSNVPWITVTSAASGTGSTSVTFNIDVSNSLSLRTGTLTIAGITYTVNQAGVSCTYSLSSTSANIAAAATTLSTNVTTNAVCPWTAVSNVSWITVTSGSGGTGNGTVNFSVAVNTSGSARSGTLTIAGKTYTVSQRKN
ncbi:MAG: BACON domain-containing protein [Blastocatellia bacterium]